MTYTGLAEDMQKSNSSLMCMREHLEPSGYDENVPHALRATQEWMARSITTPLNSEQKLDLKAVPTLEEEAFQWIRPSSTLSSHERLELYSQQYWWRLLQALEGQYPLTRRILGGKVWHNQVAVPYLKAHVPRHWSLDLIDDRFLAYLKETPVGEHPAFTYDAARLDYAYLHVALWAHHPALSQEQGDIEQLFESTLYTQPHLFLLEFPGDLFAFREEVLRVSGKRRDYYMQSQLPTLELGKVRYFVLFRQPPSALTYVELSQNAARYLRCFIAGSSIEKSLEWVETQDKALQNEVSAQLSEWLKRWVAWGWLSMEVPKAPFLRMI